jgi:hypothetical protein
VHMSGAQRRSGELTQSLTSPECISHFFSAEVCIGFAKFATELVCMDL